MAKLRYPLFHPRSAAPHPLTVSADEFRATFPREGDHVEFKEGVSHKQIQKVITALSNTDGGVVLIGVRDDGAIVGRSRTTSLEADIHRAVREVNDPGRYWIHDVDVDGKTVVVIAVAQKAQ